MIDPTKIRVGDEIDVRVKVIGLPTRRPNVFDVIGKRGPFFVSGEEITAHYPAPREFKVGDQVRTKDGQCKYRLIAKHGEKAWVWPEGNIHDDTLKDFIYPLSDLEHADEG